MRRYETIFISDPDISEDDRTLLFGKIKDLIAKLNGYLVVFDEWGVRKLAYTIKKKGRGYYVRIDFCGDGALVDELERSFRIDDRVIKFMTIVLSNDADLEKIKEEIAREAEAEAKRSMEAEESSAGKFTDMDDFDGETENDVEE